MFRFIGRAILLVVLYTLSFLFLPVQLVLAALPEIEAIFRRRRPAAFPVAAAACLAIVFFPVLAFAADDTTVPLAPWVAIVKPYLDFLVQDVITLVIVPGIGYAIYRWLGIRIDTRYSDQLSKLMMNAASGLIATGAARVGTAGIDVHSPALKAEADKLISYAPNAVKWFKLTPESVADRIVQKIPQVPAVATSLAPAVTPAA